MLEQPGRFAHRAYVGVLYRTVSGSVSDVYRAEGWASLEGIAGNMLSLHRARQHRPLPRSLRLRYASLWNRWKREEASIRQRVPAPVWEKLSGIVVQVAPPPVADTLLWRARDLIVRVVGGS